MHGFVNKCQQLLIPSFSTIVYFRNGFHVFHWSYDSLRYHTEIGQKFKKGLRDCRMFDILCNLSSKLASMLERFNKTLIKSFIV